MLRLQEDERILPSLHPATEALDQTRARGLKRSLAQVIVLTLGNSATRLLRTVRGPGSRLMG